MTIGTDTDSVHLPVLHVKEATDYQLSLQVRKKLMVHFWILGQSFWTFPTPRIHILECLALEYSIWRMLLSGGRSGLWVQPSCIQMVVLQLPSEAAEPGGLSLCDPVSSMPEDFLSAPVLILSHSHSHSYYPRHVLRFCPRGEKIKLHNAIRELLHTQLCAIIIETFLLRFPSFTEL
jgi:hypothetical protein